MARTKTTSRLPYTEPNKGRGEDMQVALLLKGQIVICLETPKEKKDMKR